MNSFSTDDLKRESVISSSSSLSKESETENNPINEESKIRISFSEKCLFFGPLILCFILLISGIILFIIIEQRNTKYDKKFIPFNFIRNGLFEFQYEKKRFLILKSILDNYLPIVCPFREPKQFVQSEFALNQLKCALHRSFVIGIYYSKNLRLINPGENLTRVDTLIPPVIQFNKKFLSNINTKSFVLILIDPVVIPNLIHSVILHWIRYISLSLEYEEDICYYKLMDHFHIYTLQKIFLLYATNSSQMMIRAKTICNQIGDPFQLTEYITLIQLKLIGSTNFFIPYVPTSDE